MIDNMEFFAYKIDFVCDDPDVHYSSFILLVESRLADDVGNFEVDLHLVDRVVKSSVSSCGQVPLDAEQVNALFYLKVSVFGIFISTKHNSIYRFLFVPGEKIKVLPRIFIQWDIREVDYQPDIKKRKTDFASE